MSSPPTSVPTPTRAARHRPEGGWEVPTPPKDWAETLSLKERYLYGSSRLGMIQDDTILSLRAFQTLGYTNNRFNILLGSIELDDGNITAGNPLYYHPPDPDDGRAFTRGKKLFELSNHLGNVLAVISDYKLHTPPGPNNTEYTAIVLSKNDYYPFGMIQVGRNWGESHRFGFQGQEKDDEVKGVGNSINYKYRVHDPRIGRFLSIDPLAPEYPHNSPYAFSENSTIAFVELEGLEKVAVYKNADYFKNNPTKWYASDELIVKKKSLSFSRVTDAEQNTFYSASIYNTKKLNHHLYATISDRHYYYNFVQRYLDENGVESKWFDAASIVTRWNAVGAADGINLHYLTDKADRFLQEGNKYLFKYNMLNAKNLINYGNIKNSFIDANGIDVTLDGLSGKTLDYAMVKFEQTKVQDFINQYQRDNPDANIEGIMKSVNYSMGSIFAPKEINNVMDKYFNEDKGQEAFDFSSYDHRVKLGEKLIDKLYNK